MVLRIATDMFIERGYVETSVVAIAAVARVNTHTVCRHFGDKRELFKAVLRQSPSAIPALPSSSLNETVFDFCRRLAEHVLRQALHQRSIGLLRLLISESSRFPALVAATMVEIEARRIDVIVEAITSAMIFNLLSTGDAVHAAKLFNVLIVGSGPLEACLLSSKSRMAAIDVDERVSFFVRAFT